MAGVFDFGSGMPLPPPGQERQRRHRQPAGRRRHAKKRAFRHQQQQTSAGHGGPAEGEYTAGERETQDHAQDHEPPHQGDATSRDSRQSMPQLFPRMDQEMIEYLARRRISRFFINEIDQFLLTHQELRHLQPDWCCQLDHLSPLHAYSFFLKGYTKPARYEDNVFPQTPRSMILPPVILAVADSYDPELIDFFDGFSYRLDLLDLLDKHIADLVKKHECGVRLTTPEFRVLCFGIYGNPVDAYKYFEYNYQSEWLLHRYLPEHVILHELPKSELYSQPRPFSQPHPLEPERTIETFPGTRLQMARACDAGVDVIEVLLEELVSDLARRGFRRLEINDIRRQAEKEIDLQRKICGSADIVDMVMGLAHRAKPVMPTRRVPRKRIARVASRRITAAKSLLKWLLSKDNGSGNVTAHRRRAERNLVLEIIHYATGDRTMSRQQVHELLRMVPEAKKARKKLERVHGVPNLFYILSAWL